MSNPFFDAMGGGNLPGPMGNMMGMIRQFNEFRQSFQGDPKAKVQELFDLRPDVPEPIQRIAGYGKSVPADVG